MTWGGDNKLCVDKGLEGVDHVMVQDTIQIFVWKDLNITRDLHHDIR